MLLFMRFDGFFLRHILCCIVFIRTAREEHVSQLPRQEEGEAPTKYITPSSLQSFSDYLQLAS